MAAIQGIELSKSFQYFQVLNRVSFEVKEGECYALFGPNGAGKTTLLRILATLHRPTSGRFEICGHDGLREKMKVREALFLISHGSYLYDDLSVLENIRFAIGLRGAEPTGPEIKRALDRVGIGAFGSLKSRHLSAGMKKRLSIAKAMLARPSVLLLDEAYASLDERGVDMMNAYIREVTREGTTVLITAHDRAKTAEVAHRAGVLNRGELRELAVNELLTAHALF
ncbi:MAG: heme ABC exporter ATP-binding protein CcmA [Candidatus Manganitrophus sp.]|uniref:Heme ABC exporter ATP-binding protein CcmA n=1 Tax=Candidatus Manganitrophus noduliformans TaxID=2606439 RepID=A0A7X6DSR7_9BACT|nr:heme ABC exporter ATP-binding protein CcmA [Candidatus Manganitrophus noduliformans]MCG3112460.1 heme ABC exporter ATP-binding protein CcmA [Candidatus Manganitrophus morganii]MDC4204069.1 heme ABC exporter ATP-binding protein CcmA [Candidatus Manganitrophus sp.]MDC4223480.1 heme ABC exporter ATP-binding protein CcmA [Candidatus Manganitrophus sp.]NKE72707.1 heme ABC exporter ATP-binding protein CcmA [Candidatus Manganitrophus noduliformans]WDT70602.1 MAG: heme ABC exporter ATP-binding prot